MKYNYETIDLTRLTQQPKCAVLCATREESELLVRAVHLQMPQYTKLWGGSDVLNRGRWKEKTAYTLFIDETPERLLYGREQYFLEQGYEVLTLDQLAAVAQDLPETNMPIEMLLGLSKEGS